MATAANGREPADASGSAELFERWQTHQVLEGLQAAEAYGTVSLDAPVLSEDETEANRLDMIGIEDARLGLVEDQATVFAAARRLPAQEREVLYLRFGADLTQSEIADRVG